MKKRSKGFLAEEHISHDSEQFDYIAELHRYLWRFVRTEIPSAQGSVKKYIDSAIKKAEQRRSHHSDMLSLLKDIDLANQHFPADSDINGELLGRMHAMIDYLEKEAAQADKTEQRSFCHVCNLPTDGKKCYYKRCPVEPDKTEHHEQP